MPPNRFLICFLSSRETIVKDIASNILPISDPIQTMQLKITIHQKLYFIIYKDTTAKITTIYLRRQGFHTKNVVEFKL